MTSHPEMDSPKVQRLPNPVFWAGRRVFLTGHTSFHGAWTALWLEHLGANVMGFSCPPMQMPNLYEQGRVAAALASHFVDLRDRETMEVLLEPLEFDVVIHMALPSHPSIKGDHDPTEPTASLLHVLRRLPMLQAIVITSEHQDHPAASSLDSMQALISNNDGAAFETAGIPLAHAQLGSLVGGGDYGVGSLIPNVLRAYDAQSVFILEAPESSQPWQHVLDAVSGTLVYVERLVAQASTARTLSFVAGTEHTPMTRGSFVSATQKALNAPHGWRPSDDTPESSVASSANKEPPPRAAMTFTNQLDPRQSIAWALRWYLNLARGADLKGICLSQIATYERLAQDDLLPAR